MSDSVNLEPFNWCPLEDETWYHVSSFWIQDMVGGNVEVSDVLIHMNQYISQHQWTLFGELVPRISNVKPMEIRASIVNYVIDFGGKNTPYEANKGFWFKDVNDVWFKCELPVNGKDEIYMLQTLDSLTAYNHVRANRLSASPFVRILANVSVTNRADVMASLLLSSDSKSSYTVRGNLVPREDCMELPRLQVKVAVAKYILRLDKPREIGENGIFWVCDMNGMWYKLVSYSSDYKLIAETALKNTFKSLNSYNFPADHPGQVWRHLGCSSVRDKFGAFQSLEQLENELVELSVRGQLLPPENCIQPRVVIDVALSKYSIDYGLHHNDPNRGLWVQDVNHVWYKLEYPYDPEYREIANQALMNCNQFLAVYDALNDKNVSTFVGRTGKLQCKHTIDTVHSMSNRSFDLNFVAKKKDFVLKHLSATIDFDKSVPFIKSVQSMHERSASSGGSNSKTRTEHKSNVGRGGDSSEGGPDSSEGENPNTENETKVGSATMGVKCSTTATKGLLAQLELTMLQDNDITSHPPVKAFQARPDGRDTFPSMEEHYEPAAAAYEVASGSTPKKRNTPKRSPVKTRVIETSSTASQSQQTQTQTPASASVSRIPTTQGPTSKPISKMASTSFAEEVEERSNVRPQPPDRRGASQNQIQAPAEVVTRTPTPMAPVSPPVVGRGSVDNRSVHFAAAISSHPPLTPGSDANRGWSGQLARTSATPPSTAWSNESINSAYGTANNRAPEGHSWQSKTGLDESGPLWSRPGPPPPHPATAVAPRPLPAAVSERSPPPNLQGWHQSMGYGTQPAQPPAPLYQTPEPTNDSPFQRSQNWVQRSFSPTAYSPPPTIPPAARIDITGRQFKPPVATPSNPMTSYGTTFTATSPPPPIYPSTPSPHVAPSQAASAPPLAMQPPLPVFKTSATTPFPPNESGAVKGLSALSGRYSGDSKKGTEQAPSAREGAGAKDGDKARDHRDLSEKDRRRSPSPSRTREWDRSREIQRERGEYVHTRHHSRDRDRDRRPSVERRPDRERSRDRDYARGHRYRSPSPPSRKEPGRDEFGRDTRTPCDSRESGLDRNRDSLDHRKRDRSPSFSVEPSPRDHRRPRSPDRAAVRAADRGRDRDRRRSPSPPPRTPLPPPPPPVSSVLVPSFETRTTWPYNKGPPAKDQMAGSRSHSRSATPQSTRASAGPTLKKGDEFKDRKRKIDFSVAKNKTKCLFFTTSVGCKNGDKCEFAHTKDAKDYYGPGSGHVKQREEERQQAKSVDPVPSNKAGMDKPTAGFKGMAAAYTQSHHHSSTERWEDRTKVVDERGTSSRGPHINGDCSGYDASGSSAGAAVPNFLRPKLDWEQQPQMPAAASASPPPFKKLRSTVSPEPPASRAGTVDSAHPEGSYSLREYFKTPANSHDAKPAASGGESSSSGHGGRGDSSGSGAGNRVSSDDSLVIDVDRIKHNLDKRTSVMLQGIPRDFDQQRLERGLDSYRGAYDSLLLPMAESGTNKGFCFLNFLDFSTIPSFVKDFTGRYAKDCPFGKGTKVTYARLQPNSGPKQSGHEKHQEAHEDRPRESHQRHVSSIYGPGEYPVEKVATDQQNSHLNDLSCDALLAEVSESVQNALNASEVYDNEGATPMQPADADRPVDPSVIVTPTDSVEVVNEESGSDSNGEETQTVHKVSSDSDRTSSSSDPLKEQQQAVKLAAFFDEIHSIVEKDKTEEVVGSALRGGLIEVEDTESSGDVHPMVR